jgi:hypothetical protein
MAGLCTEVFRDMDELTSLLFEINIVEQDRKINNWENENVTVQANGYSIGKLAQTAYISVNIYIGYSSSSET